MAKVFLQSGLEALSGRLGDWVFQRRKSKTVLSKRPINTKEPSEAQIQQRKRFKKAKRYANRALANETARAFYEALAEEKDIPVFALCVGDFLNPPAIEEVDLSAYNGHEGSQILIETEDDTGVVSVQVSITDGNGTTYESGNAVEVKSGGGEWTYTTTTLMSPGMPVQINVVAKDRPGGTAEQNIPVTIS